MRYAVLIASLLFLAACEWPAQDSAPAGDPLADADTLAHADTLHLPETQQDTLWIEGMAEPTVLHLYRSGDDFPMPFRTYLPGEWRIEDIPEERSIAFTPVGPLAGRARVSVRAYPPAMTLTDAVERLHIRTAFDAEAPQPATVAAAEERPEWAITEMVAVAGPLVRRSLLGAHGGRFFEIVARYPVEAGDGFEPRKDKILSEWRWEDTGEPLTLPSP